MPQLLNLALYPCDPVLARDIVEYAQDNLLGQGDGYLLGADAHPHITVCQLELDDEQDADSCLAALRKKEIWKSEVHKILLTHLYVRPGKFIHAGKYWIGLAVEGTPSLMALQRQAVDTVTAIGAQALTKSDDYFPHLTLARGNYGQAPQLHSLPPMTLWQREFDFALSIGRSNRNGVYLEKLKSCLSG